MKEISSLISPQDYWVLWTFLVVWAAISIFFEQKTRWGSKITGPVIALIGGMILSNGGILPVSSPVYDTVWEYIIPLVIPLFLMQLDIKRIVREAGRMFASFHISALGTVLGAIAAVSLLHKHILDAAKIGGVMTASYIGGAVNFVAMVSTFVPPKNIVNSTIVADNILMAFYIIFLLAMPKIRLARRIFPEKPFIRKSFSVSSGDYWKAKPISLLDISLSLSIAFVIATLSIKIADFINSSSLSQSLKYVIGQKFLILTTFSLVVAYFFSPFLRKIKGNEELATFMIYLFFILIGIPASIKSVIIESPLLLLFCGIMVVFNMAATFGLGKLAKFELEELILVSCANIAGPMNAAAIAISKGWEDLILPSFLVGIWGYVIGNYIGFIIGTILIRIFS